jgi:hypothetical protein
MQNILQEPKGNTSNLAPSDVDVSIYYHDVFFVCDKVPNLYGFYQVTDKNTVDMTPTDVPVSFLFPSCTL